MRKAILLAALSITLVGASAPDKSTNASLNERTKEKAPAHILRSLLHPQNTLTPAEHIPWNSCYHTKIRSIAKCD